MRRRYGQESSFGSVSLRERRDADQFFADLFGRRARPLARAREDEVVEQWPAPVYEAADESWSPPTYESEAEAAPEADEQWGEDDAQVIDTKDPDEIIVVAKDGTRYHVRRKIRGRVVTRPGRPRAGFCIDDDRVFLRVAWCEGTQGTIDAGANAPAAIRKLFNDVATQISQGATPEQIKNTFENASLQPFITMDITKIGAWKVTGNLELDVNRTGIVSTKAQVSFDRGWFRVGVEVDDDINDTSVLLKVEFPLGPRTVSGKTCPMQEVALWWDAECYKEVPTTYTISVPGTIPRYETCYLYFEHESDLLRRDPRATTESEGVIDEILQSEPKLGTAMLNRRVLDRLDYLVGQGWWVEAINGYTSPEGRRGPPKNKREKWEGNEALSKARAEKVSRLLTARYGGVLKMRRRMRFPPGKSMPTGTGKSEYPMLDARAGVELEGSALDTVMIKGNRKVKPFLELNPDERTRMTEADLKFIESRADVGKRAERLFENLRRVEIQMHFDEKLKPAHIPGTDLVREDKCPQEVLDAAVRKWGSMIPLTKPDPPVCP